MYPVAKLGVLTFSYVLALGLASQALAADQPTVAVLDFVAAEGPVDNALLGAADLLEAELGRYDMRVISRRELRVLLGERGLARSGFTRIEDFQGGTLPWADFLLRGEYQHGQDESSVRFRLVDAATGTERGSWQLFVERPADLLKHLDPILPKIAQAVCGRWVTQPRPRNQRGFTAIPEVASTFYHGLDHLVAGRPEYAAEYFRIAVESDPNFSLAALAQAKAYEQLGFPGIAEALRGTMPEGSLPDTAAAGASAVLTVRFVNRGDTFTDGQMQRIRSMLQADHGFALFDPEWIPELTRETDLKLSGDFPLMHGLDHRLWLRADHLLVFSAEKKGLCARVIDLAGGQYLGTVNGGATDLAGLCAQAVATIREPRAAALDVPAARTGSTNAPAVRLNFTYSVDEVAYALSRLADQPKDLARWVHLLCIIQMERMPPEVFTAFINAHAAAIPPDAPDAPVWLASAFWARYMSDAQQATDMPDIEPYFAPLLQHYPDSLQSQIIRFHIARFFSSPGEQERSRERVVELAEKVAPRVLEMDSFIPLQGQYVEGIEHVDYSSFPNVMSPEGPRMKMLARDMFALAAFLSAQADDTANARKFLSKAQDLQMLTMSGHPRTHHFGGPVSIYPVNIGVWQTGHIGYNWKPADPEGEGRVLVGWTFLPYAMPGKKRTFEMAPSTYGLIAKTAEMLKVTLAPNPKMSTDTRSAREIWAEWLNTCTNGVGPYIGEATFHSGENFYSYACVKERAERGAAVVDFAREALAEFRSLGPRFAKEFGEITTGKLSMKFTWIAAHLCLEAGEPAEAWRLIQDALAWRGRDDLKSSLRYQSALAAWQSGHDDTAAAILRTLAEDPRCKDLRLLLPDKTGLPSIYQESVDLLEKVRSGPAPDGHPAAIDLAEVKPYYMGITRPGAEIPKKRKRDRGKTKDESWAEIMEAWLKSMEEGTPLMDAQDVQAANYEDWPEEKDGPPPSPPPRFGEPYVCTLEDEVGIEFVWIDAMRIWAAKYEFTEDMYCYLMTSRETGEPLPWRQSYNQSVAICAKLNEREKDRLPDGYCFRIPTVSEWEALARCGTDRIYPWGNEMPPTLGNYAGLVDRKGAGSGGYRDIYQGLAPVEESGRNEWGLYGMGGNMQEWATSPDGKPIPKGGSRWHSHENSMRIDDGFDGIPPDAGYDATLRCVLAPERRSTETRTAE